MISKNKKGLNFNAAGHDAVASDGVPTFFAKYTCVETASCNIQTYQNKAKNLCTIYFVFDLVGECKFIKTKHYSD